MCRLRKRELRQSCTKREKEATAGKMKTTGEVDWGLKIRTRAEGTGELSCSHDFIKKDLAL